MRIKVALVTSQAKKVPVEVKRPNWRQFIEY
jgi:hypothetical protein